MEYSTTRKPGYMTTTIFFTRNGKLHDLTLVEDNSKPYRYNAVCDCGEFIAAQNSLEMMNYEIDRHKVYEPNGQQRAAGV